MAHGHSKSKIYFKFLFLVIFFTSVNTFSVEKYVDLETYCSQNQNKVTLALVYNMANCIKCYNMANSVFEQIINHPGKFDINPIGVFNCFRLSELNVYEEQLYWKYDMVIYPKNMDKFNLRNDPVLFVLDKNCEIVESIRYIELEEDFAKSRARLIYAIKQSLDLY